MVAGLQKDMGDMKIKHLELQRAVRATFAVAAWGTLLTIVLALPEQRLAELYRSSRTASWHRQPWSVEHDHGTCTDTRQAIGTDHATPSSFLGHRTRVPLPQRVCRWSLNYFLSLRCTGFTVAALHLLSSCLFVFDLGRYLRMSL